MTSYSLKHIVQIMNRLSKKQQTRVISALVEGNSIRSTSRMTGVARNTVTSLLLDVADVCAAYHDRSIHNVRVRRLQCDEIWAFVRAKNKNATPEQKQAGWGDVWTWTAIDADTKLCVSYYVGDRGKHSAYNFMSDCANRIIGRPQITTDAHRPYLQAIEDAFGTEADYAVLHKVFGASNDGESRYSPATCIGSDMKVVNGNPDPKHVSTSFVERQNLSMRIGIRRFTLLTNAFSKKVENHAAAVALWFAYYNFCRVHQTLRVTPAMEAGLSDHVWSVEEMCGLLPEAPSATKRIDKGLILKALGESLLGGQ